MELKFSITVSPDSTDELCGDCLFIENEAGAFCRLFGCETLHEFPDRTFKRTGMCRHFERSKENVTIFDQEA